MNLKYTYEFEDYLAIHKARIGNRRYARARMIALIILVFINFALTLFWMYQVRVLNAQIELWMLVNLAVVVFVALYVLVFKSLSVRWYFRQHMVENKEINVEINDEGIVFDTGRHRGESDWSGIIKANEKANHFILWVNQVQAYSIPKRAFSDDIQIQAFRDIIRASVSN